MKGCWFALFIAGWVNAVGPSPDEEALALYRAGRYDAAEALFRQLVVTQPERASGLYHLGKLAVRRGDYGAAVGWLERAVALAPGESDYHLWLGNGCAWAAATAPLGDKAALGRKCLGEYRRALELAPDNIPARFSLMNFYRHVPRVFGGGLARAYEEADQIARRDPVQGAFARAVLQGQEKHYTEAFASLGVVLRGNPSHYGALCTFGRLALESGDRLDAGAATLRRCLELRPAENDESHETVSLALGQLAELQHALGDARQAYEHCLKLNPCFQPAVAALARLR